MHNACSFSTDYNCVQVKVIGAFVGSVSNEQSSSQQTTDCPGTLRLANGLAACVISARLKSTHREWAASQLVRALSKLGKYLFSL